MLMDIESAADRLWKEKVDEGISLHDAIMCVLMVAGAFLLLMLATGS